MGHPLHAWSHAACSKLLPDQLFAVILKGARGNDTTQARPTNKRLAKPCVPKGDASVMLATATAPQHVSSAQSWPALLRQLLSGASVRSVAQGGGGAEPPSSTRCCDAKLHAASSCAHAHQPCKQTLRHGRAVRSLMKQLLLILVQTLIWLKVGITSRVMRTGAKMPIFQACCARCVPPCAALPQLGGQKNFIL